jgi:hypothetical protein
MEPHRNLGIRRLDEAEDPAGPLIDPELEVLHTILTMGPDVLGMVVSNVFGRRSLGKVLVQIHNQRHDPLL